ncbi:hypothetical protein QPK87_05155 [Kamptonema cortianum]|nr:hypothetical protein [Geitlerinema splendidum]MDK3155964.1 hypothetical protein [Kamptonema cortianum]
MDLNWDWNFSPLFAQFSGLLIYIIWAGSLWSLATKLGDRDPWHALIPILNLFLISRLSKTSPWLWLTFIIPPVGWVVNAYIWAQIGRRRNRSIWGWLMLIPCFWYISPIAISLGD